MAFALRASAFTGVQVPQAVSVRQAPRIDTRIVAVKSIQGRVTSDKMQNTITVAVDRYRVDRIYGKRVRTTKTYHVHDPNDECEVGDVVTIVNCRPLSKTKAFTLEKIVRKVVKI